MLLSVSAQGELSGGIRTAAPTESAGLLAPFPPYLGWAHYLILLRVANPTARAFYEVEAAKESWSSRELEREAAERVLRLSASINDPGDHDG